MAHLFKIKMEGIAADEGMPVEYLVEADSASDACAFAEHYSEGGRSTDRVVRSCVKLGKLLRAGKVTT